MTKPTESEVATAASIALNSESVRAVNFLTPMILAQAAVLIRAGLTTEVELEQFARRLEPELEQKREQVARDAARRELEESPGLALMLRLFGAIK